MNPKPETNPITIVIPLQNAQTTIKELTESLEQQHNKELIRKIIIINDNSTDNSPAMIAEYARRASFDVSVIHHKTSKGTAFGYNEGIRMADTDLVIILHQDIVLVDADSFSKAIAPFASWEKIVATYPTTANTLAVWETYNFWQKCFFRSFAGTESVNLLGKFDCIKKPLLLAKVGLFDDLTYRTAGEDGDMRNRIRAAGLHTSHSGVRVVHIHGRDPRFGIGKLAYKESQYAEATGVGLRRYGMASMLSYSGLARVLFRPFVAVGVFVPCVQLACIPLMAFYSIFVTWKIFVSQRRDPRVFILPLVNIAVLYAYSFYLLRGFITKRQQL
jgi:glycosyltransferase involved in cell wall biosynthesis